MGPTRAQATAERLLKESPIDLFISAGFAGSLDTSFGVASILLGDEVVIQPTIPTTLKEGPSYITCDSTWVNRAKQVELMIQSPIHVGRFISVDRILARAVDKHALAQSTSGIAVDMESGAIGKVAQRHGVPFLIVRAISDRVDEDLPLDFSPFLHRAQWVKGVMQLVSSPRSWRGIVTLYKHSQLASHHLSQFFKYFLSSNDLSGSLPRTHPTLS